MKHASTFIKTITGDDNSNVLFQLISEDGQNKPPLLRFGTLKDHIRELKKLNSKGYGIFMCINEMKGSKRSASETKAIRALWVEMDNNEKPNELPIEPSMIVRSKRGEHIYYCINKSVNISKFKSYQTRLINFFNSDPSIKDPARVMRLPGFYHMKDPNDPYLVKIKYVNLKKYDLDEVANSFPVIEDFPKPKSKSLIGDDSNFSKWVESLPIEEGSNNKLGGRNRTLLIMIREGLSLGIHRQKIYDLAKKYCERSKEPTHYLESMIRRQQIEHKRTPFSSFCVNPKDSNELKDVAHQFLIMESFYDMKGRLILRHYRGDFYLFSDGAYSQISSTEIRSMVVQHLQKSQLVKDKITTVFVNNLIMHLQGLIHISESIEPPTWIGDKNSQPKNFIAFRNGLIDVDHLCETNKIKMIPHSPDFFNLTIIPHELRKVPKLSAWKDFLDEMLPDKEVQSFLQEWFGYNLLLGPQFEHFVLLVGQGANGKSVVCVVLKSLLGEKNYSAVSLEQFNPSRTFVVASMNGKLANIVEEISEVDKSAEGLLKNLTSNGVTMVERKNKDPFPMRKSPRLTFATNVLPKFADRTDGLWRRIVAIPFDKQILDPEKQDTRLVNPKWWVDSGEINPVLIWAITGLRRLLKRKAFIKPKASKKAVKEYQEDSNPILIFLNENCKFERGSFISTHDLYQNYVSWVKERNHYIQNDTIFRQIVKKQFPYAVITKNAKNFPSGRSRAWINLKYISGDEV